MNDIKKRQYNPAMIVGIFLSMFGALVLIAIAYTPTYHGKITNLVCGITIVIVAFSFILISLKNKNKSDISK